MWLIQVCKLGFHLHRITQSLGRRGTFKTPWQWAGTPSLDQAAQNPTQPGLVLSVQSHQMLNMWFVREGKARNNRGFWRDTGILPTFPAERGAVSDAGNIFCSHSGSKPSWVFNKASPWWQLPRLIPDLAGEKINSPVWWIPDTEHTGVTAAFRGEH